jgi:hypothetical protein
VFWFFEAQLTLTGHPRLDPLDRPGASNVGLVSKWAPNAHPYRFSSDKLQAQKCGTVPYSKLDLSSGPLVAALGIAGGYLIPAGLGPTGLYPLL